jgi:DNA polymerase-3 subunit epsilon
VNVTEFEDRELSVIEWACGVLKQDRLVVFDTEATDLGRDAEVVQLGIIDAAGETLVDMLVRPAVARLEDYSVLVHGIDDEDLANAPTLPEVLDEIESALEGAAVLGYNVFFDHQLLRQSCEAAGIRDVGGVALRWFDLMDPYAQFYGAWSRHHQSYAWQPLSVACEREGVPVEDGHSAVGDCRLTLALLRKLASCKGASAGASAEASEKAS